MGWVAKSTLPQAQGIRRFLNTNLAALPAAATASLCRRFNTDPWRQVFFEMIVGRFLQLLGAKLDYEPVGENGRKVDWLAALTGGPVYIEATSPVSNAWIEQTARRQGPLLDIIETEAPPGWSVSVRRLPAIGPNDSRRPFRAAVQALARSVPDPATVSPDEWVDLSAQVDQGAIRLAFRPVRYDSGAAIVMSPGGAGRDDTGSRIVDAVRDTRPQGRAFPGRVILAVDAPSSERQDFDAALLGHTVATLGEDLSTLSREFRRAGELARQAKVEYPAVLVFPHLGMFGGYDPIVYMHPRFEGVLPSEFASLETRSLGASGIETQPATRLGIIDGVGFPPAE
jgi:hypothetical protein